MKKIVLLTFVLLLVFGLQKSFAQFDPSPDLGGIPTPPGLNTYCNGATVADLVGATEWYATPTGGTPLPSTTVLTTGTEYWFILPSYPFRLSEYVYLNITEPPVTASTQTFCGKATVSDLSATGYDIKWYSEVTGGTALSNLTPLITGTYYASQTLSGCESMRAAVAITVNPQPTQPTISCYQTSTWNSTACKYDISGTKPSAPVVACYQTVTWNDNTCKYDIIGSQPAQPTVACYQTATWNSTSCQYDISGTKPSAPSVACYQTATWNGNSCQYDVTGTKPIQPIVSCFQTATWNSNSCQYDISGTKPYAPSVACYQTATWNSFSCQYDITGTKPVQPAVYCYQTATWNGISCQYDISGSQPSSPPIACYQTSTWNGISCQYDITGSKPAPPTIACYESATWNGGTCQYDILGTKPAAPSVACYETATWNGISCQYDIIGSKPAAPTIACYESATWNGGTCQYDISGTKPAAPSVACYETATWNGTSCQYDITGSKPAAPPVACYQTATWNGVTCQYDVTGSQPSSPSVACYQTATWNSSSCQYDITGSQPLQPTVACYQTATWNSSSCQYDITGTKSAPPTVSCYQTATWNSSSCQYDITGNQPLQPTVSCYQTATWNGVTCQYDIAGNKPAQPSVVCSQTVTWNGTTCQYDITETPPTQPSTSGQILCYGSTVANLVASGADIKWYTTESGGTALASTAILNTGAYYYTNTINNQVSVRNLVVVIVNPVAKAGGITSAASVCFNGDITFSLESIVGDAVQWEYTADEPLSSTNLIPQVWSPVEGATGFVYTKANVTNISGTKFYIRAAISSGKCTTAYSAIKTILVNPASVGGTLTGGGVICMGGGGTLKLSGYNGAVQWLYSNNGTDYDFVPLAKLASLKVIGLTQDTWYKAQVTNGLCSLALSNPVKFEIGNNAIVGNVSAESTLICKGTSTTLQLTTGNYGTLIWEKSIDGGVTWFSAPGLTNVFKTPALNETTWFRATTYIGTSLISNCTLAHSNPIVIKIIDAPLSKGISGNTLITTNNGSTLLKALSCNDNSKILTVVTGYSGVIQWQWSTTSSTSGFNDIDSEKGTTYVINSISRAKGANFYRAKFTNSCGVSVYSSSILLYYKDCVSSEHSNSKSTSPKIMGTPFDVIAYPNPFTNNFTLAVSTSSKALVNVKVYDVLGRLIEQSQVQADFQIGASYQSGVYQVIVTQESQTKTLKIIKK